MKYKTKQLIPAINKDSVAKLLDPGTTVNYIDNNIITDDGYTLTSIYNDYLNNTEYFEQIKEIDVKFIDVGQYDDHEEKNWRMQFDFYCTEKRAEEIKKIIWSVIKDI